MASDKESETKGFWKSLPGLLTGIAALISAIASLGILDRTGVINVGPPERKPSAGAGPAASSPPELKPTPSPEPPVIAPPPAGPDCSKATHPGFGSAPRTTILDANRRHYSYSGKYVVNSITAIDGWAYVEGYPQSTKGPARGYLMSFDGSQWNWRWEGPAGAPSKGPGDPPYPADFQGAARDVLSC